MSAEFTAKEKERIKYFLSYPDWVQLAQSIQLGVPAGSQPLFLVEGAFGRISPEARESARKALCECECTEAQISDSRSRMKVISIGEIKTNPREPELLRRELLYWVTRLADVLGVIPDPYSQMMYQGIGNIGGINARVLP
jgi:hypothetical protein